MVLQKCLAKNIFYMFYYAMNILFLKRSVSSVRPLFQKITEADITSIKNAEQVFSDCYMVSSLHALAKSSFGRNFLTKNINKIPNEVPTVYFSDLSPKTLKHSQPFKTMNIDTFRFTFNDVYGKRESYCIAPEDFKKNIRIYAKQKTPIIRAMEIAMNRLVHRHFFKKPLISRLQYPFLNRSFEFNMPSNFLKTFTGVKPLSIGEKGLNMTLKTHKDEVVQLFKKMSENPDEYSFVAGTGLKTFGEEKNWHCFVIENCDYEKQQLTLCNKRHKKPIVVSFDKAIETLKYITGYFKEDFKI